MARKIESDADLSVNASFYKALFDGANEGIFLFKNGRCCECNTRGASLLGVEKSDVLGRTIASVFCGHQPSDQVSKRKATEIFKKAESGTPQRFEWFFFRKDGESLPVEIRLNRFDIDGNGAFFLASTRDIVPRIASENARNGSEKPLRRLFGEEHLAIVNTENAQDPFDVDERGLCSMFNKAPFGIIELLPSGRFINVNQQLCDMLGYTRDEMLRMDYRDITYAADMNKSDNNVRIVGSDPDAILRYEKRYVHKKGFYIWVRITLTGLKHPDGKLQYLIGAVADINEQKKASDAIKASEEKMKVIFNHHYLLTGLLDVDGRLLIANDTALNMIGARQSDVRGEYFWETPWWTHSKPLQKKCRDAIQSVAQGASLRFETTHMDLEGNERNIDFTIRPMRDDTGRVQYIIPEGHDITDFKNVEARLQKSEARFRKIFMESPLGIALVDRAYRFVQINPMLCQMMGYAEEELINRPMIDIVHPDDVNAHVFLFDRLFESEIHLRGVQQRYIKKNAKSLWGNLTASVIGGEDDKTLYGLAMIEDITERKKAEEDRELFQARLQKAQQMEAIGTLAGGIAHDFNNILSAIIGYSELIEMFDVPRESPAWVHIKEVLRAANRAKDLVSQILTFSRHAEAELQPVQLSHLVKEVLKFLRASLPTTIEIQQNIQCKKGLVRCDPTQMHRVLMNLCTNAAHAIPNTGGTLGVALTEVDLNVQKPDSKRKGAVPTHLKLTISDTGCGIHAKDIPRIFEPYYTTKAKGEGTGLGLAAVHGIVQNIGGHIDVHSEVGKGTTFDIFIPRVNGEMETVPATAMPALPRGTERILFVDDEKILAELGRDMISAWGYDVTAIADALVAAAAFHENPSRFDLLITDLTMPHITGIELAEQFMRVKPGAPVILCTGFNDPQIPGMGKAMGIRGLLRKPLSARELGETIRKVLDGSRPGDT